MASYLPSSVTGPAKQGADLLRSTIGGITWGPVLTISRTAVTSLFQRIEVGSLAIIDETSGRTTTYGQKIANELVRNSNGIPKTHGVEDGPKKRGTVTVRLTVKKDAFWVRLFLFADMGFSEAYMLNEVECNDLVGFFKVCETTAFDGKVGIDDSSCSSLTAINFPTRLL